MSAQGERGGVVELLAAWDDVDDAAARVATALPSQIGPAVERLEVTRKRFRRVLQVYAASAPPRAGEE